MIEFIPNPQIITRVHLDLAFAGHREEVRSSFPDVAIFLASFDNFTELNRYAGDRSSWAGLSFAGNPQVHAFDDLSILETPSTIVDQVRSAEALTEGLVSVGPLTFEPTGWISRPADTRIETDLYAVWVLACVISAAEAGAYSVTVGETGGHRGFVQNEVLSPAGEVLAQLGQMGSEVKIARTLDPTLIMGIEADGVRLIAHLGENPRVETVSL